MREESSNVELKLLLQYIYKSQNILITMELVGILNISNNKYAPQSKIFALYEKGLQVQPTTQNVFSCNIKKDMSSKILLDQTIFAGHRRLITDRSFFAGKLLHQKMKIV